MVVVARARGSQTARIRAGRLRLEIGRHDVSIGARRTRRHACTMVWHAACDRVNGVLHLDAFLPQGFAHFTQRHAGRLRHAMP